jgi:hypothetical protein
MDVHQAAGGLILNANPHSHPRLHPQRVILASPGKEGENLFIPDTSQPQQIDNSQKICTKDQVGPRFYIPPPTIQRKNRWLELAQAAAQDIINFPAPNGTYRPSEDIYNKGQVLAPLPIRKSKNNDPLTVFFQ